MHGMLQQSLYIFVIISVVTSNTMYMNTNTLVYRYLSYQHIDYQATTSDNVACSIPCQMQQVLRGSNAQHSFN